jgi:uncharacterized protein YkuJ
MAEETLFTDIINNLGKAKKEGKLKGGYRFADDGKLKLGGGYYDDDKMFEIEVGKDNANVIFKKRFADGGSTNGSADKAFTGKVKELMEDGYEFGEAVKEAMRQGYAKGGKTRQSSSEKKSTFYKKLINNLPEGYLEDYKKIFMTQNKDGTFSSKPGDAGGIKEMEQKYGDIIKNRYPSRQLNKKTGKNFLDPRIVDVNAAILENENKLGFKKVSGLKPSREVRKQDLKLVGTFYPDAPKGMTTHHFMPLAGIEGESLNLSSTKNTAFIPKTLNSKMSPYDKKLKINQKEQIKLLKEKPKNWKTRMNQLNFKGKQIYKEAGKKVPGSKGYLGYSQINIKPDGNYNIKVTGIDPNKSIAGLKGEEIIYKDIDKGDNRSKLKKIIEKAKTLKPIVKKIAKTLPVIGTAVGIADVANAYEQGVRNPIDLFAAYQISPEAALSGKKYREDPEYRQERIRNLPNIEGEASLDNFTSYFNGGIVSLKGVK